MVPPAPQPHDLSRMAQDLQIRKAQVEAVVQLLDEENTVPFITRYRKERTGGLNEEVIRRIQERMRQLRQLADRKQTILKSIAYQGKLNDQLTQAILAADFPKRLEDLYLPFKPKKKSKATEAREKGLAPLAEAIWNRDPAVAKLDEVLPGLVDPDKWLLNVDEVLAGVKEILAEMVSDSADVRGPLRNFIWDVGLIASNKIETLPEGKGKEFDPYASFKEPVREIPPHRVLAINRGEKSNVLRIHLDIDRGIANEIAAFHLNLGDHPHRDILLPVVSDSLERLVLPSLEREVRRELTERAQDHAVMIFARNLRSLLLQPPLRGKKVLAIDPGIRTGCKLAVLDETGKLLEDAVIYPHGQRKNAGDAKRKLEQLVRKHQLSIVAIGNGTGCRETEQLVADLIADLEHRRLHPESLSESVRAPESASVSESVSVSSNVSESVSVSASVSVSEPSSLQTPESVNLSEPSDSSLHTHTHTDTLSDDTHTHTLTSDVHVPPPETIGVETTGALAPAGETVTTGTPVSAVAAPPSPPPAPEISLEGLPEAPADLAYVIVIEAGASDYSASPVAREEFPTLDATTRGTISIGRRLQDPLAELVKIDPQHIGVGLYQHDVKPKHLKESLEAVIESSVNQVGVDL
ncbi:MAG TPA: Tex-like N-terminal domain-containing protein, partial [Urbifossiella sp.]